MHTNVTQYNSRVVSASHHIALDCTQHDVIWRERTQVIFFRNTLPHMHICAIPIARTPKCMCSSQLLESILQPGIFLSITLPACASKTET